MSGITGVVAVGGIAAAGTVGGALIGKAGADNAADAAERAGNAQLTAAREGITFAREAMRMQMGERARSEATALRLAKKSPAEMAAVSKLLKTRDLALQETLSQIEKDTRLLVETTDPIIREAGAQQLQLLKGESSKVLAPFTKERERSRRKLEDQLASKFGPGYLTSTAGIEAMTRFDDATATSMTNLNFQALNQVASVYTNAAGLRPKTSAAVADAYTRAAAIDSNVLNYEGGVSSREVSAFLGAQGANPVNFGAMTEAQKGVIGAAGAPFQGDIMRGNSQSQLGGAIMGIGANFAGQALTYGMFSNFKGADAGVTGGSFGEISNPVANAPGFKYDSPTFGNL